MPGRPKIQRKKSAEDTDHCKLSRQGVQMQCKHCFAFGHNKRGCPFKNDQNPPRQPETRTRPVSIFCLSLI